MTKANLHRVLCQVTAKRVFQAFSVGASKTGVNALTALRGTLSAPQ